MAAIAENLTFAEPAHTKKARSRKALKPKNASSNETNIVAEPSPIAAPPAENSAGKENHESLSHKKTKKGASKGKQQSTEVSSFEKQLQEMQEQLEKLKIEKEQTEEILKAKEESLKQKEEELQTRDREQEKLKIEFKKLQKIKEFKPTVAFPLGWKDLEQEKKEKKKGGKKKPSPPYVLWCKDQWNEVKKANPDADFKEMSNLLGAKWKTITAEEKKPYEERYQTEKEGYLKIVGAEKREHEAMKLLEDEQKQRTAIELLEQYLLFIHEAEKENTKKTKKEKDPLKPKHPLSAYFVFSNERRAALLAENKKLLEVAKITGEEWKNMTDKQKAPYEKIALKKKEQYMQEMEVYKQKKEEEAAELKKDEEEHMKLQKQEAMQLLKKKEETDTLIKKNKENRQKKKNEEKIVDSNKPKRPASSYLLFSKEARKSLVEERPGMNNTSLTALISLKWKEMGEEEKHVWSEKAAAAMEGYKKELEAYNKNLAAEEAQKQG